MFAILVKFFKIYCVSSFWAKFFPQHFVINELDKKRQFFCFIQHYLKYNCIISRKCNGKEWASNYLTLKVKMWHCGIFKIALLFFENVQHNNEAKTKWFNLMILISHGFWCQRLLHLCISYCINKLLSSKK